MGRLLDLLAATGATFLALWSAIALTEPDATFLEPPKASELVDRRGLLLGLAVLSAICAVRLVQHFRRDD